MTVRFGIIGTGGIAESAFAPALGKVRGAELWSVLSRDAERGRAFATRHGARSPAPVFTDLAPFLADPRLDAVIIASPDRLHASQAILAAQAKKHVLCEKPMAASSADARAMTAACRAAGVRLGVAFHLRWHAGHRIVAAQAREGALGELRHARVQWTYRAPDASNWRASNAVGRWWALAATGPHCLDMARWMLSPTCGEVIELRSVVSRHVHKGPHDESAVLAMRFASGATASITVSVLFDSTPVVEVFGTAGSAICEGTLGRHGAGRIRVRGSELAFAVRDPFEGEVDDFVRAIEEGRDPEVNGEEGTRNTELLEEAAPV
jgi:1,5-anhydro-D-fructose reductase (1,5-anhydro-D-mannitol-forming)